MNYDKKEIKEQLSLDDVYQLLVEWGGEPEYTPFGIISATICHNTPGEGSRKLYFYQNSNLFHCFTGCNDSFDIFELAIKVARIQKNKDIDLNEAVRFIAYHFGISGTEEDEIESSNLEDWNKIAIYENIQSVIKDINTYDKIILSEYDNKILDRFNYTVKLEPWLKDHINQEVLDKARIGFFPSMDQITIPHYDEDGRFIGLRVRNLCLDDIERYGKYRPARIGAIQYTHPLGMNLYGLNWSKNNILNFQKAIVLESEKSVLQYASYFGFENNICVACCGSSLSAYQMSSLIRLGAKEVIIGFDRQFKEIGDNEFKHLTKNLTKINEKYKNYVNISFIFDKEMITQYKASPTDEGKEKFLQLFKERICLN